MMKQILIALAAAFLTLPVSFLLISHGYQALHPVDMAHGYNDVVVSSFALGFFGAPVCAALVFILTLYLVYRYDHNAGEEE